MLPKKHRVGKKLGQRLFKEGTVFSGKFMYLKLIPEEGLARFSVVVPKKVARTSPARHRIKRQVNHCLLQFINHIPKDYAGLFFVKKEAVNVSYKDLCKDTEDILHKAGFL